MTPDQFHSFHLVIPEHFVLVAGENAKAGHPQFHTLEQEFVADCRRTVGITSSRLAKRLQPRE